jgi:DNA-binding beta-propeller fold protein YncE
MKTSSVVPSAALLVAGAFVGCNGLPQRGSVPSIGVPPAARHVQSADRPVSWTTRDLKRRDLLYVSNPDGIVNVYLYWQHTLVRVLNKFANPMGECTDAAGDVYIVDEKTDRIYEYAHGGTKAIKTLDDSPQAPYGCAVSPATGDLAVANYGESSYGAGNITIYHHAGGAPTVYSGSRFDHFVSCSYDRRGDLFTASDFALTGYPYRGAEFYYLPRKATSLISMTLPYRSRSFQWYDVQAVAWDGKYWVVEQVDSLYRYVINVKARYVSTTELSASPNSIAIYHPVSKSNSEQVVGAVFGSTEGAADYWDYPAGGSLVGQITQGLDDPYGVAISLRTQ